MSDIAKTVVNGGIDAAETAANAAVTATEEAVGMAASVGKGAINVGEKSVTALMDEGKGLLAEAFDRFRKVANAVTEPLP